MKIVPSPAGDLTPFLNDENFAQQCFLTAEPLQAKRKGVDVKVFLVSDIGYNPYTTVMATSGDLLAKESWTWRRTWWRRCRGGMAG